MARAHSNHGQSAVELIAIAGVLAGVALVACQLVFGAASWIGVAGALRADARAELVGGSRDVAHERFLVGGDRRRSQFTLRVVGAGLSVTVPEATP